VKNILIGCIYGILAQILTFIQLQGNIKYHLYEKYPIWVLLASIPMSWLYIQSVYHLVMGFNGQIWPSRILGFVLGIIVFTLMSHLIFKESLTLKTIISIILAFLIFIIQVFIK
jgi:hypothetical protein